MAVSKKIKKLKRKPKRELGQQSRVYEAGTHPHPTRHGQKTRAIKRKGQIHKQKAPRKTQQVMGIPGLLPTASAMPATGKLVWKGAEKTVYRLKSFFGTKGKPLTPRQQAQYEKTQRKIKQKGGMFEFEMIAQTGTHKALGPKLEFWSKKQKKMVETESRGAPREYIESQWGVISGPAEAGTGADPKLVKLVLGKKKGDGEVFLPKEGVYTNLTDELGSLSTVGRAEQAYKTGRFKPKKDTPYYTPPGAFAAGMATKWTGWFDQPGKAAILKKSIGKTTAGKIQKRVVTTTEEPSRQSIKGVGKQAFAKRTVKDKKFKGTPRGKTQAVLKESIGKSKPKIGQQTLDGSVVRLKEVRGVRKDILAGKITPAKEAAKEVILDRAFHAGVNEGKIKLSKSLSLAIWNKLSIKDKASTLHGFGLA